MAYKKSPEKCATKFCRNRRAHKHQRCSKCMMREWRKKHPVAYRLMVLRQRAKRKNLPFDLDRAWLSEFLERTGYDPTLHHIDRICVLGGYTKNNIQVLSISDNTAKGNRERHGHCQMF